MLVEIVGLILGAGLFIVLISVCIWLLFLPADIASHKGSSWIGFFLLSICGLWIVAMIWAYFILEDKSVKDGVNL